MQQNKAPGACRVAAGAVLGRHHANAALHVDDPEFDRALISFVDPEEDASIPMADVRQAARTLPVKVEFRKEFERDDILSLVQRGIA